MTAHPIPREPDTDAVVRDRLSSMQGLLALSMVMTESGDEQRILHLASTSVPALGGCRLGGVYFFAGGWRGTRGSCAQPGVQADVQAQFAVLDSAGGPVAVLGEPWGWAFPLRSLEGHLGYLVVGADAAPAPFDQFLLRVLAQQTGIALANARLHQRQRASAAGLRAANVALTDIVAAYEYSTAIHDRLTRVAAAGEGQEGIAQAVHELTGHPVAVEDRWGNLRAWAGGDRPDPYPKDDPARRADLVRRALREGRPVREDGRLLAVASPREDVLGVLVLFDPDGTAGDHEQVALEHGVTVLAMELARLQSLAETELRLGRDLVEELLAGADADQVRLRAQGLGVDLERPRQVLVVDSPGLDARDAALLHVVRRTAREAGLGQLLVGRGREVVVLAHADRPWEQFRRAVQHQLGGGRCRVGVGGGCVRPADFPRSYREARLALRMQDVAGSDDRVAVFDHLGVYRILAEVAETDGVEHFVREWLGALLDYDAEKHTELVTTLSLYLACGGNYDQTSRRLSVHRSTLKYRLQRIREISGHELGHPETRFNLELATRARQTLLALRSAGS